MSGKAVGTETRPADPDDVCLGKMAEHILTVCEWDIFLTHEHEGRYNFAAIHQKTGETVDICITGYRMPKDLDFFRLASMGWPKSDSGSPFTSEEIARRFGAQKFPIGGLITKVKAGEVVSIDGKRFMAVDNCQVRISEPAHVIIFGRDGYMSREFRRGAA